MAGRPASGADMAAQQPAAEASFWAKPEWAPFFGQALAGSYVDCSLAKRPPPWADAAAAADDDAGEPDAKPLWLALRHPGGATHTRASLDTFENLDDKLVLAKALAAAGLSELAPPQLIFEHDDSFETIVERIEASPPPSLLSPPGRDAAAAGEAPPGVWVLKWAQGFGGQDIHFVQSAAEAATIISSAYEENEAMR